MLFCCLTFYMPQPALCSSTQLRSASIKNNVGPYSLQSREPLLGLRKTSIVQNSRQQLRNRIITVTQCRQVLWLFGVNKAMINLHKVKLASLQVHNTSSLLVLVGLLASSQVGLFNYLGLLQFHPRLFFSRAISEGNTKAAIKSTVKQGKCSKLVEENGRNTDLYF